MAKPGLRRYWAGVKAYSRYTGIPIKEIRRLYRQDDALRRAVQIAGRSKNPQKIAPLAVWRGKIDEIKSKLKLKENEARDFKKLVQDAEPGRVVKMASDRRPSYIDKETWEKLPIAARGKNKGKKIWYYDKGRRKVITKDEFDKIRNRGLELRIMRSFIEGVLISNIPSGKIRETVKSFLKEKNIPHKKGKPIKLDVKQAEELSKKLRPLVKERVRNKKRRGDKDAYEVIYKWIGYRLQKFVRRVRKIDVKRKRRKKRKRKGSKGGKK